MSRVVIHDAAIKRLFANPNGPVAKLIKEKANAIESHARTNIQTKYVSRTGELEGSLHQVPFTGPDGSYHIAVGADAQHRGFPYARALELGKDPIGGGPLLGGNTQGGPPQKPVDDKKIGYMVPAVRSAGFRER